MPASADRNVVPTYRSDGRIRVSLPTRIAYSGLIGFGIALLALQLLSGTEPVFALLVFCFVLTSGLAFNVGGGFDTVIGFALAMMALKTVLISQLAKLLFWQPADSNLEVPQVTLAVFVVGFLSMTFGVLVTGAGRRMKTWLPRVTDERLLLIGAVITLGIGTVSAAYILRGGIDTGAEERATGALVGLAYILVRMLPMSIIFATAYTIVRSAGRRSVSPLVVASVTLALGFAAVQGTKQGVFETVLYYILTCIAFRFAFYRRQLVGLVLAGVVGIVVVWPILQTLKNVTLLTSVSISERIELMGEALSDLGSVGEFFEASDEFTEAMSQEQFQYYGKAAGWLDRFSLIEPADELIAVTLEEGELGWYQPSHAIRQLAPRIIDPDKPATDTGNFLGHRIGFLTENDDITQIAFGIIPESFSSFSWTGVLVIPALLIVIFVNVMGRLANGYANSVWMVYLFGRLQHSFVEQSMSTMLRELLVLPILLLCVYLAIQTAEALLDARTQRDG